VVEKDIRQSHRPHFQPAVDDRSALPRVLLPAHSVRQNNMTVPPLHPRSSFLRPFARRKPFANRWRAAAASILIAALAFGQPGVAAAPEDISGVWLTQDDRGGIEIRPCGAERCGYIVWTGHRKDQKGDAATDRNNPDPDLRSRRICGLQIISGLKPEADGGWGRGRVYNPETGKTYGIKIRREAPDVVKATGYLGLELLGQTMEWRVAPKGLAKCEGARARR
jgi:uncharacterized protein (DUF2147 family)